MREEREKMIIEIILDNHEPGTTIEPKKICPRKRLKTVRCNSIISLAHIAMDLEETFKIVVTNEELMALRTVGGLFALVHQKVEVQ